MQFAGNKLYQRVATSIAAAIDAGTWLPGARLPGERDLAEEYQVSRPTIREAMIALEMRGWIEARHGSGLYVTRREQQEGTADALELDIGAFDLTEARILFEGEAAALAAVSVDEAQLAEIDAVLAEMAASDPEAPGAVDADRRFHLAVAAATGNAAIRSVVEYLWDMRYRSPLAENMFARARRGGIMPRVEEHRPIAEALHARDPHAARAAMRLHLRRVVEDLLATTEVEALERTRDEIDARRDKVARRLGIDSD